MRRRGTATTLPDHPRALAGARLGPETTAAAKAAAGAANVAAGSSVSLIEKDARLCLSLQQEIRSVHRVLLQVPSPARRARRHGGAPAAAAATAAATPSHRATLDLYAGNGIAKAQSTAVRLENALREAMLEDVRTSSSTSASSGAIASKKLATLRKLLDRATRELVRRCLHPSVGCPTSTREPASRHRKRHDTTARAGGVVSTLVLPLVEKVVALGEQAEAERAVYSQLEVDLKRARARAAAAEEKAELIRLTLDEKNSNNSNSILALSGMRRRASTISAEASATAPETAAVATSTSTAAVHCQTAEVVLMTPSAHRTLMNAAHDYRRQNDALLKERNVAAGSAHELRAKDAEVLALEAKLAKAAQTQERLLQQQKRSKQRKERAAQQAAAAKEQLAYFISCA